MSGPLGNSAIGLARLPLLESHFSHAWPQTATRVLPTAKSSERLWAPLVAWLLIDALASSSSSTIKRFEELHLRAALADIFRSLGIVGEDAWRAAARVRILLVHRESDEAAALPASQKPASPKPASPKPDLFASDTFWADPDVRWLTALNESNGITYVNKECLQEMVWWMQVPRLVRAASDSNPGEVVKQIELRILRLQAAADEAAYDLDAMQRLLHHEVRIESTKQVAAPTAVSEGNSIEIETARTAKITSK